jgi:SAM-dependent methyltransferase
MEGQFYKYMRFPTEVLYERYDFYIPFFKRAENVLDLGCGTGEFLELLQRSGKNTLGVDDDDDMIQTCSRKGLNVVKSDVFEFLEKCGASYDGIFCAHLAEHLGIEDVHKLISLCRSVLKDDGILVLVTPNPLSLETHLKEFWRDPSHLRMYDVELLSFLVCYQNFEIIQAGENPKHRSIPPPLSELEKLHMIEPPSGIKSEKTRGLEVEKMDFSFGLTNKTGVQKLLHPLETIKRAAKRLAKNMIIPFLRVFAVSINEEIVRLNQQLEQLNEQLNEQLTFVNKREQMEYELIKEWYPPNEVFVAARKSLDRNSNL